MVGTALASLAVLAVLGATPTRSAASCEPLAASWLKRALQDRSKARDLGAQGRLSVGGRLVVEQLGAPNKLVVEGGRVGYAFATRRGRLALGWRAAIRLVRFKPEEFGDKGKEILTLRRRHIGRVNATGSVRIALRVPAQRGLFRVDLSIRSRKGRFVGGFDRYLIGVSRTLDARLDTHRPVYSPGQEVRSQIENIGTQGIGLGANVAIERQVDGRWIHVASEDFPGRAAALEGAQVGGCASLRLPKDAPAGAYRAIRSIRVGRSGAEATLTAPFKVE